MSRGGFRRAGRPTCADIWRAGMLIRTGAGVQRPPVLRRLHGAQPVRAQQPSVVQRSCVANLPLANRVRLPRVHPHRHQLQVRDDIVQLGRTDRGIMWSRALWAPHHACAGTRPATAHSALAATHFTASCFVATVNPPRLPRHPGPCATFTRAEAPLPQPFQSRACADCLSPG